MTVERQTESKPIKLSQTPHLSGNLLLQDGEEKVVKRFLLQRTCDESQLGESNQRRLIVEFVKGLENQDLKDSFLLQRRVDVSQIGESNQKRLCIEFAKGSVHFPKSIKLLFQNLLIIWMQIIFNPDNPIKGVFGRRSSTGLLREV
ncbi:hypothetical protein CEXT_128331 [Caerostris extrusa]|uniref:Uncharacterized protein n=1 Tax=Caerostris extrusa TaxID=172846 RepID=A0AAV4XNF5_CAEEX|nr:hypothetical protein CEXT_128331 [Caerostris extrusa]